jgi:hypothetical protein
VSGWRTRVFVLISERVYGTMFGEGRCRRRLIEVLRNFRGIFLKGELETKRVESKRWADSEEND